MEVGCDLQNSPYRILFMMFVQQYIHWQQFLPCLKDSLLKSTDCNLFFQILPLHILLTTVVALLTAVIGLAVNVAL